MENLNNYTNITKLEEIKISGEVTENDRGDRIENMNEWFNQANLEQNSSDQQQNIVDLLCEFL